MRFSSRTLAVVVSTLFVANPPCLRAEAKAKRFTSHEQAGSTHVSILTVAPWDDYVQSLQPVFEMTAEKALSLALPTTSTEEEQILKAFTLALNIAGKSDTFSQTQSQTSTSGTNDANTATVGTTSDGATTKNTGSTSQTTGTTNTTANTNTNSATQASGNLSNVPSNSISGAAPALGINPADTAAKDPLLQYQAASAIYQEVQLLSRQLKDIAVREGFVPYVVRAQVAVMPRAHHSPYDTYTTISFFEGRSHIEVNPEDVAAEFLASLARGDLDFPRILDAKSVDIYESALDERVGRPNPIVLPVLVTDHLEGRLHSRTTQDLKEFLLAAVALQSTAASAKLGYKTDKIRSLLATDLNSLLTVARINDNSLRVRFGAASSAVSSYEMVAQTHTVTFVLLVHKTQARTDMAAPMHFQARTSFYDAQSGMELPLPSYFSRVTLARKTLKRFEKRYGVKFNPIAPRDHANHSAFHKAMLAAANNDRRAFTESITQLVSNWLNIHPYVRLALLDSLWLEAVNSQALFHWHSGEFDVPAIPCPKVATQNAILLDDKKAKATVTLLAGERLRDNRIDASLKFNSTEAGNKQIELKPLEVKVASVGGRDRLELVFPSPSLWKATADELKAISLDLDLARDEPDFCMSKSKPTISLFYNAKEEKPTAKPVQFAIKSSAELVRADRPLITIEAQRTDKETEALEGTYFIELGGAIVDPEIAVRLEPADCLASPAASLQLKSPACKVTLSLASLGNPCEPTVTATVKRKDKDGTTSGNTLTWKVLPPAEGWRHHGRGDCKR